MKVKEEIEKELSKATEQYEQMKGSPTRIETLIRQSERIKFLTWVLSDKIDDLEET